jgi:hypothetical protein
MAKGRKTGGRVPGSLNKRSVEVAERLARLGCEPIEGMARIAMDKHAPLDIRARMFAELASYCYAKRRAVEHADAERMLNIQINLEPRTSVPSAFPALYEHPALEHVAT